MNTRGSGISTRAHRLPLIAAVGFALAASLMLIDAVLIGRYNASIQESLAAAANERETLTRLFDLEEGITDLIEQARSASRTRSDDAVQTFESALLAARALLQGIEDNLAASSASASPLVRQGREYLDLLQRTVAAAQQRSGVTAETAVDLEIARAMKVALDREIHVGRAIMAEAMDARRASIGLQLERARRFNWAATMSAMGVLVVFAVLVLRSMERHQDAAAALAALNANLEQTVHRRTAELAELSQHLLAVREEERAALARDLHDQIGSELSALQLDCARLESATAPGDALGQSTWPRIRKALGELTLAHRRIINSLHPTVLDHLGLEAAVRALLDETLGRQRIPYELCVDGSMDDLPPGVPIAAYRVIQEAVSNVLQHAHAKHVQVHVARFASVLVVEVTDDGIGLGTRPQSGGRLGLVGMRERAKKLGGSFEIGPGPGHVGTRVIARFDAHDSTPEATTSSPAGSAPGSSVREPLARERFVAPPQGDQATVAPRRSRAI